MYFLLDEKVEELLQLKEDLIKKKSVDCISYEEGKDVFFLIKKKERENPSNLEIEG
jgi:uncharacterized protein YfkK (UPF0435 family)